MLTNRTFSRRAYPADPSQSNRGYDPAQFAERERARIEFEKARAERNRREDAEREFRQGCED